MKAHMKKAGDQILRDTTEATPVDNILSSFTIALQKAIDMYVPAVLQECPNPEKSPLGSHQRLNGLFENSVTCSEDKKAMPRRVGQLNIIDR